MADGYTVALRQRAQRIGEGWRPAGRKIGFTNRTIWPRYGVYEPIWGTVYEETLTFAADAAATVSLAGLAQPRIEPEVCFRLRRAPRSPEPENLLDDLEWMAHAVEIVQCDQPGWKTSLEHATAANGLHGRLVVGAPVPVQGVAGLEQALPRMTLELSRNGAVVDRGAGANVLGSPLAALGYLVVALARQPEAPPLAAGEIVTTGTLTDAHAVAAGETWSTRISGVALPGLTVKFI